MTRSRPDVVFDCNVFLQAISRVNGPAAQSLRLVEQNAITLYIITGKLFRQRFPSLHVVSPVDFVAAVMPKEAPRPD